MIKIHKKFPVLIAILSVVLSSTTFAHGRYILPSHTVLSGESATAVTLISSISNDVFNADRPLGDNRNNPNNDDFNSQTPKDLKKLFTLLNYQVIDPKGEQQNITWQAHKRFSVADLPLLVDGTYRISIHQPTTYMTTFKHADGSPGRIFGKQSSPPKGSKNIVRRTYESRTESFISYNRPNRQALIPLGKGLEMASANIHPNDLFVGEKINFQLYLDGKPLTTIGDVVLTKDGTRHRNQRNSKTLHTGANGKFQMSFEQPGFYLLEANVETAAPESTGVDIHSYSLYVTLEVFPE